VKRTYSAKSVFPLKKPQCLHGGAEKMEEEKQPRKTLKEDIEENRRKIDEIRKSNYASAK